MSGLAGSDLIVHAGDICIPDVLAQLASIAPVAAVAGNNDDVSLFDDLPRERRLVVGRWRILLFHGDQPRHSARDAAEQRAGEEFDCILYGHSHRGEVLHLGETLLVNPGSPTSPRAARRRSFAILNVGEHLRASIVDLE
jgi:putative phosphoesterase